MQLHECLRNDAPHLLRRIDDTKVQFRFVSPNIAEKLCSVLGIVCLSSVVKEVPRTPKEDLAQPTLRLSSDFVDVLLGVVHM